MAKKPKKEKPIHGQKVSEAVRLKTKGYSKTQADKLAGIDDDLTREEISDQRIVLQKQFPKAI
jgi:hypothetical protein